MKLFTTSQIRQIDAETIEKEPIASIDLMERAAENLLRAFRNDFSMEHDVLILAGAGNNGGDGLALARKLLQIGYATRCVLLHTGKLSEDCEQNRRRLVAHFPESLTEQKDRFLPPEITPQTVIIDALFGSGLRRPLAGIAKAAAEWMNSGDNTVISIDLPSGLNGDGCADTTNTIVRATVTYTLQFPKLAFLLAENEPFVGRWKVVDIQLHPEAIAAMESRYFLTEQATVSALLKPRARFAHKGTFGHALIGAGSRGMAGAAVLAAKGALHAGAGLVSVWSEEENRIIIQTAVPEALFTATKDHLEKYDALGIGPGWGVLEPRQRAFKEFLQTFAKNNHADKRLNAPKSALVLDADALNILAENSELFPLLPENCILTPHPKEFERLFGASENSAERIQKASEMAVKHRIIIILKGAFTLIALPDGTRHFNPTGNPGMATGGTGDVLTGVLTGLLAQGYTPRESALLGTYLHGLAADLAADEQSPMSLLPSHVINFLGKAFLSLLKCVQTTKLRG